MKSILYSLLALGLICSTANAQIFSELEPNPAGGDPTDSTIELFGTALATFDLDIISIENDGFDGSVDRLSNVTGSFDSNGLAVVTVPDLENPSFTVVLSDGATVSIGDDLDVNNDGNLDVSNLGTILDSVGISDNAGDDASLYSTILGGSDILFNGEFEPLGVFRDASTGSFYQYVTVDFGGANEHVGVFAANGGPELDPADFINGDPLATTYGAINPTFSAVPEPTSSMILFGLGLVAYTRRRRS